jgi:hypothetical protein
MDVARAWSACQSRAVPPVPGGLEVVQSYHDSWRGWPVRPLHRQHPVRGSFLDPRPDPRRGAVYHTGVDVAMRDDRPERGAPPGRTHRVHAIEGGRVLQATARGVRGFAHIAHFGYGHIEALVDEGEQVSPGQVIGWTWQGSWHVHLSEFVFLPGGRQLIVNPLRRGGKLQPYIDRAPPAIREIRFYRPATARWRRRAGNVAVLPQAGKRLDRRKLSGRVDVRVRADDPQSFVGWFRELPHLAAPHHPFRIRLTVYAADDKRIVERREVFRSEQLLELPAGQHYAPGTDQNLPAAACARLHARIRCDGIYWFRLVPRPFWDTTRLPNGRYRLRVRAWDAAGNSARAETQVSIKN